MADGKTSTASQEGVQSDFPQSPSAFDADDRVSFSRLDQKFILETEEGTEFEWDGALRRWIPALDQSLLDRQGEIYKVAGVDETEDAVQARKKRKKEHNNNNTEESAPKPKKQRVNTGVYVTSIPLDADEEEIQYVFSKCGVIAEEIDSGRPRIKMYENDEGRFKGDALVVYFRPESVNLAIQMLDDTDFRLGVDGPMGKMKVQAADFSYKKQQGDAAERSGGGSAGQGGGGGGGHKPNKRDQQKVIKKTAKMNSKLADWSDDDDNPSTLHGTSSRWDKVVVLKHMFTLEELQEDPATALEIKEDIRDECSKLGEVTNVVLFDKEPEGVATVRFGNAEAASACVRLMNGRWFDERQLEAYIADGSEKFKKAKRTVSLDDDDDEDGEGNGVVDEEGRRLDKFGSWLEGENGGDKK